MLLIENNISKYPESKNANPKKKIMSIYYGGKVPNSTIKSVIEDFKIAHKIKFSGPIPMETKNSNKVTKIIESPRPKRVIAKKKAEISSQKDNQTVKPDQKPQESEEMIPSEEVIVQPVIVPPPEPLPSIVNKILELHWFPLEKVI